MILSHLCPFYMFFMFILVVILVFILPEKFNKKYLIYTLSGLNKSKALLQLREGYVVNEGEEDIDGGKLEEKEFIHLLLLLRSFIFCTSLLLFTSHNTV